MAHVISKIEVMVLRTAVAFKYVLVNQKGRKGPGFAVCLKMILVHC